MIALVAFSLLVVTQGPPPSLPGAVTKPPAWLNETKPPFDVAKFFAAPPMDQNAAPLYLDALLEFSPETADCFPDSEAIRKREATALERSKRATEAEDRFAKDPASVPDATIAAIVAEHDLAFRKLAEAQRRPRCMFEPGITVDSLLPHAQAARQVVRVTALRVAHDVKRGDFDRPIGEIASVLRLCRDLTPRGYVICGLVSCAVENRLHTRIVPQLLAAPGLSPRNCDRLVKIFAEHQAHRPDIRGECLKADYIFARSILHDGAGRDLKRGSSVLESQKKVLVHFVKDAAGEPVLEDIEKFASELRDTKDAEYRRAISELDLWHDKIRANPGRKSIAEWNDFLGNAIAHIKEPRTPISRLLILVLNDSYNLDDPQYVEPVARTDAGASGMICLIALKRWQLTHGKDKPPQSLAACLKEAGITSVPLDPFDGKPFKLSIVRGNPVVYSVGMDRVDNGGRFEANFDTQLGDIVYRLRP